MRDKTVDELAKAGIFIGTAFEGETRNKRNIKLAGKRKNFSPNSKGILLGKTIKGASKKLGI